MDAMNKPVELRSSSRSTASRSPRAPGETLLQVAQARGRAHPAPVREGRPRAGRQLPRLRGRGEGRTHARAVVLPHAHAGHDGATAPAPRAVAAQKMVLELLHQRRRRGQRRAHPRVGTAVLGRQVEGAARPPARRARRCAQDASHPAFEVNLDACIQCTRCIRACRDIQVNDVLGLAHARRAREDRLRPGRRRRRVELRGLRRVRAGLPDRRADAGARRRAWRRSIARSTRSARTAASAASSRCTSATTTRATRRSTSSPAATARPTTAGCASRAASASTTCTTSAASPRRWCAAPACAKDPADIERFKRGDCRCRRCSARRAGTRRWTSPPAAWRASATPRRAGTPSRLAGFGSAKGSNEEAYLFQKLVRTGLRTHNVDHCTRLCHASSVAALLEGLGSGAVSQSGGGRGAGRRHPAHRRQPGVEPPGGGELDQERGAARHDA